jgi:hypothetical protein
MKYMKTRNQSMSAVHRLLFLSGITLLSGNGFAQKVKDLCPDSKVIKEAKDLKSILERFPDDRACGIGQDEAVDKLSAEIVNMLLNFSNEIKTKNPQGSVPLDSLYNLARNSNLFNPMDKLAQLIEKQKMQQRPPQVQEVVNLNKIGEEFNALVAEMVKKEKKSQDDIEKVRKKEKEYLEAVKKVMEKTAQGRKALECYQSPAKEFRSRLPDGKMPEIRLTSSLLIEQNRPIESTIGGSFSTVCTHTDPIRFETELSLSDSSVKPMEMVYELTHELTHACDGSELGDASLQKKLAEQSKIPPERMGKFGPVLQELKFETLLDINKSNMFIRWLKNSTGAPGSSESQNPMMVSYRAAAQKLTELGLSTNDFENFISELSQDQELRSPLIKAEKNVAFTQAKSEIKAFRSALQIFKELSSLDPSFCSITNAGISAYGPIVYSPADFFRTLEETDLKDHIMNLYSYKNGLILRDYIYETKKLGGAGNRFPSKESVLLDPQGRPIYTPEFAEFLKSL